MELLLGITVSVIGFVVLAFIKRSMERKKNSTTQSIVWWQLQFGGSKYHSYCELDLVKLSGFWKWFSYECNVTFNRIARI